MPEATSPGTSPFLKSGKALVFATIAGVLILLQFTMLAAVLDLATSFMLLGVGFVAGRMSK